MLHYLLVYVIVTKQPKGGRKMKKEAVLKGHPHISDDLDLEDFLFFMG